VYNLPDRQNHSRAPAGQVNEMHARSVVITKILITIRRQLIIVNTLDSEDGVRSRTGMMRGRLAGAARGAANVQYTMHVLQCA